MPSDIKEIRIYRTPLRGPVFEVKGYFWGQDGKKDFLAQARQLTGCDQCEIPNAKDQLIILWRQRQGNDFAVGTKCPARKSRDPRAKCKP
jgi:hypothetical protein